MDKAIGFICQSVICRQHKSRQILRSRHPIMLSVHAHNLAEYVGKGHEQAYINYYSTTLQLSSLCRQMHCRIQMQGVRHVLSESS